MPFSQGRLTRIARGSSVTDYRYDRFGRLTQDGELAYGYDANGNPSSLVYPGGMTALTSYDFADRPATLKAQRTGKPDQAIVTASSYLPSGPLKSLTLGNGLVETHAYSQRYFPSSINLGGLLSWTYTTDKTGNISGIADSLNAANNRTYGYQDHQYFLTQGNGPWGTRSWTYDRIGNRLTETRGGITDTYTYQLVPTPGTGHSPILSTIQLGAGGSRSYQYDPAGNLQQIAQGTGTTLFTHDDDGRLAALSTTSPPAGVSFRYDGRDYLTLADTAALPFLNGFESGDVCGWSAALGLPVLPSCTSLPAVHSTYSSDGLLHALQRTTAPQRSYVLHFAGRPVAQMDLTGTTESWKLLTVDHLGTPIAATGTSGSLLWQGGFEPFGADWSGAGGAGVFLRFPGQWADQDWENARFGAALYYNVHRLLESRTGRYISPDPLGLQGGINVYGYARANPLTFIDPLGLMSARQRCIARWVAAGAGTGAVAGAAIGGAAGGAVCTPVAPGVGTVGCGAAGGSAGAAEGAAAGGALGGAVGSILCKDVCDDDGDNRKLCPPCKLVDGTIVPIGTIGYRHDTPSRPQHGIEGPHLNLYIANQNPHNCQCFWQPWRAVPPPPLPGWIPIMPFFN